MLEQIRGPADLQHLSQAQLEDLAHEIRDFLIHKVAATGGHLGPNLGVVELTLALHRVFDSPHDPILFDTGHQAYVHKMLTGRCRDFDSLRKKDGLSGYPSSAESEHDWIESSHASSALSYADGLAKAFELSGHRNRHVVAVVGDGALTGGMCWEALNNIAASRRPVVIVVNDNGRSYAPTIGGFAEHLAGLRLQPGYERVLEEGRKAVRGVPMIGEFCYQCMHSIKVGIKDALSPQVMFTDLGLKYVGPIDGHDEHAVESALRHARAFNAPVVVHVVTRKGMGYAPAENDADDQMHACGVIDPETGLATSVPGPGWTSTFSEALIRLAGKRRDIVAITAAMPGPTGLSAFRDRFPDRFFDVGIAEQHAMTSAAGLAMGGMHPVVAIYSTFLNRAFDQMLMDVALHKLPVTVVLDRSGVTGPDGASHNGMWDLSILGIVPGMRVAAPRDGARLREELGEALDVSDGPTAIRFPKGDVGEDIPAIERRGDVDVLAVPADGMSEDVLLVAVGPFAAMALAVADRLRNQGIGVTVVDPRWVLPVPEEIATLATRHKLVVTLEDNGGHGGVGSAVSGALRHKEIDVPCRDAALPQEFFAHASRGEVLESVGLTERNIARQITGWVAALGASTGDREVSEHVD
ncbi:MULTISPECIES: 1-deoxy-D-xylulose-5-phosphate synthase [Mycolicibacterium]|jgi:1-deoxy-D-xylulose-5-phosphate synthase|uniref:1-deoxy-D-xylulose-5-phosphate synthase n=1 Tax=Mycolicibacterium vanbaalenii (strain DSM 7251 / JCM 13017 / BCRC 16820 / KCTC 9966 / NRRL B-24157 / PYR-1) TaxID=350058 RepID=DXS_MYCVP|nr:MULTISPECIES: 1-deoxy-D-xylulose-5-phosphate synthase [Mycolicibacterium]A1T7Z0.1 RecName: Full=1-deoxy-D-xylulose-5-phosphate synthase; AltName: Full=1-deoxyxylulose-5-phosphate synthase; Short=DXP synthase; Short=DXPS [Mycolicibacterium vanbaalenii PYR-1]ABM13290.1 1-deoxy-D-xylulose-5-phosphate synthase [Mycolicibacterium vanbaalenii PYR-1]MCV7127333.1 1-deoxy-D-xylulose-5-phosphate synthase [Mycolicibacterium vanbaalenii PYR-1]QZT59245.1 1-deoxy-D-xylulose-5-phosphate synthase [Mycolicib